MKHFRVIAIDLLGFGKSDRPDFEFKDFSSSMNFFTYSILSLVKYLDLQKIVLIGHSYSGLISSHLAPLIKNRLLGVWLVSPAGFNYRKFTTIEKNILYEKFSKKWSVSSDIMKFLAYVTFDKVLLTFYFYEGDQIFFRNYDGCRKSKLFRLDSESLKFAIF